MLATVDCPSITSEIFHEGAEPTEYCTAHPGPPLKEATPGAPGQVVDPKRVDEHDTERRHGDNAAAATDDRSRPPR